MVNQSLYRSVYRHQVAFLNHKVLQNMKQRRKTLSFRRLLPLVCLLAGAIFVGKSFFATDSKEGYLGWRSMISMKSSMCKVQFRPLGTETLPRGFVSNTSDLEMLPLWGARPKNKSKQMSLLAMAVGADQKENVNKIIKKFPSTDFVLMLFHYDGLVNEWKEFEWSETAIHVSAMNQTKWWFAKRFLHPDIVSEYSYIFLWDEDLGVEHFDSRRYISIIEEEGLEISQPALDPGVSEVHHLLTAREANSRVHRRTYKAAHGVKCNDSSTGPPCTGFVEMMAPVFSRLAWRCTWYMIQNDLNHGWGIDSQLGYCAQGDRTRNIGIVDSEYLVHFGITTLGGLEDNTTDAGNKEHTSGRMEVRKQRAGELLRFRSRWRHAAENDDCWIDPFQPQSGHTI